MNPASNISGIVAGFILLFSVAWLGTCALLSLMGGWHRLAAKYRSTSEIDGEKYRFASMSLGTGFFPVRYRNVLFVTVGRTGITLSVNFLFRVLHPPLLIPWSAVETVRPETSWLATHTAVYLHDFDKRLLFRGRAGKKIHDVFHAKTSP